VIEEFQLGGESGRVTARLQNSAGYPGLSATYRDWKVSADCGDFRGEFLAVLTEDGEYPVELGTGLGCAATVTLYRFKGLLSHGVVSLTPRGDDPIPCLTMWLEADPAAIQAEVSRVLNGLA
jgi:hypothetical protein